jgi:hypothetical protein
VDLPRQRDRVALSAQMDEPHDGVEVVEVLVLGLEDQPVVDEGVDHRVDLVGLDRDVSVEQGLPVAERLEVQLAADLERRLDRDSVDRLGADVVTIDSNSTGVDVTSRDAAITLSLAGRRDLVIAEQWRPRTIGRPLPPKPGSIPVRRLQFDRFLCALGLRPSGSGSPVIELI